MMKKIKSTLCLILSVLVCVICISGNMTALADNNNIDTNSALSDIQSNEILFGNLFFNNHEDVEKLISYYDSNLQNIDSFSQLENVNDIIDELQLNTNLEETICIIQNICEINEYVQENKLNDATTSFSPNEIGILDNINEFSVQPFWSGSFHKTKMIELAEEYFPSDVAAKIGKYNRDVDIYYSSGVGAIANRQNQYIHFNQYASGSEDSRDYAASTWFVASELAWKNGKREDAYKYLGYALHPLQDKEAHGQIGRGKPTPQHLKEYVSGDNIKNADAETGWVWRNSSRNSLDYSQGSRTRYNAAVNVTKEWLEKFKNILK